MNTRTFLQIFSYALNPQTLTPAINLPLRPGAAPVSLSFITSDPSILGTIAPVTINPGDAGGSITLIPVAAGTATITIQAPAGFSTPSTGASATFNVR